MPIIKEYIQQYSVGGEVGGRRATAEDIGGGFDFAGAGKALGDVAEIMRKQQEENETADAAAKIAESRSQWAETVMKRQQQAAPDDATLAPTIRDEMKGYFGDMEKNYKSPAAKQYVKQHGATITGSFFVQGLQDQYRRSFTAAISNHENRVAADMKTLDLDPFQYDIAKASLRDDIEKGIGKYTHIKNYEKREELIRESEETLAWAASMRAAKDPFIRAQVLGSMGIMGEEQLAAEFQRLSASGATQQQLADFVKTAMPNASVKMGESITDMKEGKVNVEGLPSFIKDLKPENLNTIVGHMRSYQNQDDRVAREALTQQVNNDLAYMSLYHQRPQKMLTRLDFKNDQAGWEAYDAAGKATDTLAVTKGMSIEAGEALVESLKPPPQDVNTPGFSQRVKVYEAATRMFIEQSKEIRNDNIAADMRSGFAPGTGGIKPITVSNPAAWLDELDVRIPAAIASNKVHGLGGIPRVFNDAEVKSMSKVFETQPVEKQMEFLSGLYERQKSNPVAITSIVNQIAQGKSGIAAVGNLMMSPATAIQGGEKRDQTAGYILLGTQLMKMPSGSETQGEKSTLRGQLPTEDQMMKVLNDTEFKSVSLEFFSGMPQILETLKAHYVGKMAGKVTDLSINSNTSGDFKNSIYAVLGKAPSQVGATKVIRPYGMSDDEFKESVRVRVTAPWGTYGLRNVPGAPPTVYEIVSGGKVMGAIDVKSEMPKKEQPQSAPSNWWEMGPKMSPTAPTYQQRTGKGFYEQANKDLLNTVNDVLTTPVP